MPIGGVDGCRHWHPRMARASGCVQDVPPGGEAWRGRTATVHTRPTRSVSGSLAVMIIDARSEGRDVRVLPLKWTISITRGIRTIGGTRISGQCARRVTRLRLSVWPRSRGLIVRLEGCSLWSVIRGLFDSKTRSIGKSVSRFANWSSVTYRPSGRPLRTGKRFRGWQWR